MKLHDDIRLEDLFAAAGAIGLLSAQLDDPDPEWAADWALDFGRLMAAKARASRRAAAKRKPAGDS